jgi:hypothetical protein
MEAKDKRAVENTSEIHGKRALVRVSLSTIALFQWPFDQPRYPPNRIIVIAVSISFILRRHSWMTQSATVVTFWW